MHRGDAYCVIQRRAAGLGIKAKTGCHTFRATAVTPYLVPLTRCASL